MMWILSVASTPIPIVLRSVPPIAARIDPGADAWVVSAGAWAAIASAALLLGTLIVAWTQLGQLSGATQLENFIALSQESDGPQFSNAYALIVRLRSETTDGKLRLLTGEQGEHFDRVVNFFERIGFLVSRAYMDQRLAVDWWGVMAKDAYDAIDDVIERYQQQDAGFGSEFQGFVGRAQAHWTKCGRTPKSRSDLA